MEKKAHGNKAGLEGRRDEKNIVKLIKQSSSIKQLQQCFICDTI